MKPDLDRFGPTPIYLQIKQWMQNQIGQGRWPEHYKLVNEIVLANDLGVSRGTVRRAISDLIKEAMLVRIHGRGTFVASKNIEQPLAERLVAFSEALIEQGITFETQVLAQELISPIDRVVSLLSITEESKVFFLERVRFVAQTPVVYLHNYVVASHCLGIETVDFTSHRLFQTLEGHYGLVLDWGRRTFEAQAADAKIAALLQISEGAPIMKLEQIVYLEDGSPIEFSDVWLCGNRFRLTSTLKRNGPRVSTLQPGGMLVGMNSMGNYLSDYG